MARQEDIDWALTYDGYERIAADPLALYRVLAPAIEEFERTGRVPTWAGVDLLRAWAFYRQREAHHSGLDDMARDWEPVLDALRQRRGTTDEERPPRA